MKGPWFTITLAMTLSFPTTTHAQSLSAVEPPTPLSQGESERRRRAKELFERGLRENGEGKLEESLRAFQEAFELSPHYVVLFNIASTQEALGQLSAALGSFDEYLRLGGTQVGPEKRRQIERRIREIRARLATTGQAIPIEHSITTLECPYPGFMIKIGGRLLGVGPLRAMVASPVGETLSVSRPGYRDEVVPNELHELDGEFRCTPVFDAESSAPRGTLRFDGSSKGALVRVDGIEVNSPVALPVGPHLVTYSPVIGPHQTQTITVIENTEIHLKFSTPKVAPPTPIAPRKERVGLSNRDAVALTLGGLGLSVLGASLAVFVWNHERYGAWSEEKSEIDDLPVGSQEWIERAGANNAELARIQEMDAVNVALAITGAGLAVGATALFLVRERPVRVSLINGGVALRATF